MYNKYNIKQSNKICERERTMKCNNCNSEISDTSKFCPECGARVNSPVPSQENHFVPNSFSSQNASESPQNISSVQNNAAATPNLQQYNGQNPWANQTNQQGQQNIPFTPPPVNVYASPQKQKRKRGWCGTLLIVFLVLMVIGGISGMRRSKSKNPETSENASESKEASEESSVAEFVAEESATVTPTKSIDESEDQDSEQQVFSIDNDIIHFYNVQLKKPASWEPVYTEDKFFHLVNGDAFMYLVFGNLTPSDERFSRAGRDNEVYANLDFENIEELEEEQFTVNGETAFQVKGSCLDDGEKRDAKNVFVTTDSMFFNMFLDAPLGDIEKYEDDFDKMVTSVQFLTNPASTEEIPEEEAKLDDMTVGYYYYSQNLSVALQYVKKMDYLPTKLDEEKPADGHEVIIGFFEFYNTSSASDVDINTYDITCYADGTQVKEIENYIKVQVDGVNQLSGTLDPNCLLRTCKDFEVPIGWNELKFFYESECVWTVTADQVMTDDYTEMSLFDYEQKEVVETALDEIIFSDNYDVQYKGFQIYTEETVLGKTDYALFKFTITNNGSDALDTSLMGYNMRAYQDNYRLEDSSFGLDDKVDGFINIYNIESIAPGMSGNVYIAFEAENRQSSWHLVYDDGYIISHKCADVYVTN